MTDQPFLHDLLVCLTAPTQAWSGQDGQIRPEGAQGAYHGDVRIISSALLAVDGQEPVSTLGLATSAGSALFIGIVRGLGDHVADPTVRVDRRRTVRPGAMTEEIVVRSSAHAPVEAQVTLDVACDLAGMQQVKAGARCDPREPVLAGGALRWTGQGVEVTVSASQALLDASGRLTWTVSVPPGADVTVTWAVQAVDELAVVHAPGSASSWSPPTVRADDRRLAPLLRRSLEDLAALRLVTREEPGEVFLGAGAPWFLTLFGRDSLWAARMLLPLGTELAASTLRVLAARQGHRRDPRTAEEPGKILHEVRRDEQPAMHDDAVARSLPPVYYGTIDATPLWVCLLHDAWRWGLPGAQVEALLPNVEAALGWMADFGDADADGFLEYVDASGTGLANQGWKDSFDSVQWRDGRLAHAPLALCEVQGYAYEAAIGGADLLDAFGRPGADRWRAWAANLRTRFRSAFWVSDDAGPFPAIALDATKRPVDSLTSNVGHLLGTGLLDPDEEATVAARLGTPDMFSGFGVRTMSSRSEGFTTLGYHAGSVWPHDSAIGLHGLSRSGRTAEAAALVDALLSAGAGFDGRLPELFSGDSRADVPAPVPYPAACRPQAWAAASSVAMLSAVLGLRADAVTGTVVVDPLRPSPVGALEVSGLRFGGADVALALDADGALRSAVAPPGVVVRERVGTGHPSSEASDTLSR